MNDLPIWALFLILLGLIIISAFFSGSETSMMKINRYRLKHLKDKKNKSATRVSDLLAKSEYLISTILLGNNFVNIFASAIATIIGLRLLGDSGVAIASILLTVIILVFAEITPKTIAAQNSEKVAFASSWVLKITTIIFRPLVWFLNIFIKLILKLLKLDSKQQNDKLTKEEIRTVLVESKSLIRDNHYKMLLSIIDLEKLTVEDIMVPRREIIGINIDSDIDEILNVLAKNSHNRLPVYREDITQCIGSIHVKDLLPLLKDENFNKKKLIQIIRDPFFISENTLLDEQLKNFQKLKRRMALVVDEYGDLQGLVTLEDVLEEIVGNFTTDINQTSDEIFQQKDGSYLVNCSILVRELNQKLGLNLPYYRNAKTLNGLILHELENIPETGTSIKIANAMIEIISAKKNVIDNVVVKIIAK